MSSSYHISHQKKLHKTQPEEKPPSLTSRLRRKLFHEETKPNPFGNDLPPTPTSHPFLLVPSPPRPTHSQQPLSNTKFRSTPKRLPTESSNEYALRKARLELASKLQKDAPKSPLLGRVHPKTGRVTGQDEGFVGTGRDSNQKNRWVRPKGVAAGDDIREESDGSEGDWMERMDEFRGSVSRWGRGSG
jgi:hypothetical protein